MRKKNQRENESKELSCDDFINKLEQQIVKMKKIREDLAKSKIQQSSYEEQMIQVIGSLQTNLDGVRHTFVPLTIPEYLKIGKKPPEWIKLSESEKSQFAKVADANDYQQKELLTKFKRPSLRMVSMEKAASVLSKKQQAVKDDNEWLQAVLVGNAFADSMRVHISIANKANGELVQLLNDYIDTTKINPPFDADSATLFAIDIFGDEGPLTGGHRCATVPQEVGEIAAALRAVSQGVSGDACVGMTRPFVADLHQDLLMKSVVSYVADIHKALEEAIDLMDDVSMADFGSDGSVNVVVEEGMKGCKNFEGVERLAAKLQKIAKLAEDATDGNKSEAARMIAVVMVADKLNWFPIHFAYAVSWCSDSMYESFDMKGMFVRAFDLILHVIPDFGM